MQTATMTDASRSTLIVLGNEKGGSGKSTTAMHVIVSLLGQGHSVGAVDLDARQGTLSRYIENRAALNRRNNLSLPCPRFAAVLPSSRRNRDDAEKEDLENLEAALNKLRPADFIVIDTPGSASHLSRLGHSLADILITPLNDSFIDLDLLARIDPDAHSILGPSIYSQMVWEQRQMRARAGRRPTEWIVMRNRLSHIDARNKRVMSRLLDQLAQRIGFRLAPGFGERVVFRELFPKGLTLLDLKEDGTGVNMTMSHVAARAEIRSLLDVIGFEEPNPQAANDQDAAPTGQEGSANKVNGAKAKTRAMVG